MEVFPWARWGGNDNLPPFELHQTFMPTELLLKEVCALLAQPSAPDLLHMHPIGHLPSPVCRNRTSLSVRKVSDAAPSPPPSRAMRGSLTCAVPPAGHRLC